MRKDLFDHSLDLSVHIRATLQPIMKEAIELA